MKKTILVTGALGQIGANLVEKLSLEQDVNVLATDLRLPNFQNVEHNEQLDILDKNKLSELVQKHSVTEIYHLAALLSAVGEKNPKQAWDVNMDGLLNVLDVAKDFQCKVFWPSSIAVFGKTTPLQNTPQKTIMEPTTVYGISKSSGELWCNYYFTHFGVDVRSVRLPGLISWKGTPGGGTTDYAVDIYHKAVANDSYECFLSEDTYLPMLYMDDAIHGMIQIMNVPKEQIAIRTSYNLAGMTFSPKEILAEIKQHKPNFTMTYKSDFRQQIADSWPDSIDDTNARKDWNWHPKFDLKTMTDDMLTHLSLGVQSE